MEIDKNWMKANRGTSEYMARVRGFIELALSNPGVLIRDKMRCPCKKRVNIDWLSPQEVEYHCNQWGMTVGYTKWYHHGEGDVMVESTSRTNELQEVDEIGKKIINYSLFS